MLHKAGSLCCVVVNTKSFRDWRLARESPREKQHFEVIKKSHKANSQPNEAWFFYTKQSDRLRCNIAQSSCANQVTRDLRQGRPALCGLPAGPPPSPSPRARGEQQFVAAAADSDCASPVAPWRAECPSQQSEALCRQHAGSGTAAHCRSAASGPAVRAGAAADVAAGGVGRAAVHAERLGARERWRDAGSPPHWSRAAFSRSAVARRCAADPWGERGEVYAPVFFCTWV